MGDGGSFNVPVFSGGLFTTAQVKIWKEILNNETGMSSEWEEKWGVYKAPHREMRPGRRERATSTSATFIERSQSTPALASAGTQVVSPPSPTVLNTAGDPRGDRARVLERLSRLPARQRYKNPVTSSHAIGWCRTRPSMELFGVGEHGRQRDPNLMPDL
mmetsp:Transcript_113830/g.317933  ORF Transcript_113830/g.317933 Transcript_113830/m.317933 type:complete len:160 (+) Transcript_113830:85-564(+)